MSLDSRCAYLIHPPFKSSPMEDCFGYERDQRRLSFDQGDYLNIDGPNMSSFDIFL
jgi:hypothetical protein